MVTQIEEVDLWQSYRTAPNPELRERLVLQSVPLVHYLVGRMCIAPGMKNEYEDLVHQGLLGLIDAVDHFDPGYGVRFSTYASTRIRGKVLDYLRSLDWMSRGARQRVRLIQGAMAELWSRLEREPAEEEIAQFLGIDLETVRQAMQDAGRVVVSLDLDFDQNDEMEGSLIDVIPDENQVDPVELIGQRDHIEQLAQAIGALEQRQQIILSLYYFEQLTFKEIGQVLNISESRVCQLHTRAIMNLKAVMENE